MPPPENVDANDLLHRCKKDLGAAKRNPGLLLFGHADYADLMGFLRVLPTRVGRHLEVAELGWQAPACHSELELAAEGGSSASAKRSLAALTA